MSVTIKLDLPEAVAKEAEATGLLKPAPIEKLLVSELRRRRAAVEGRSAKSAEPGVDASDREEPNAPASAEMEREFNERADRWSRETGIQSSPTKRFMHEDYQTIMSMGRAAIPLILRRLQTNPDDWFWALKHLARDDAAKGAQDFGAAVRAWLDWGREQGYIS